VILRRSRATGSDLPMILSPESVLEVLPCSVTLFDPNDAVVKRDLFNDRLGH